MTLNLNRMSSYWNRDERIKINNNWDKIEKSFNGVVGETVKQAYDEIIDTVRDLTKINWLEPVPTYDDIAATYPNPTLGDITITTDDGSVYRYDGEQWVYINKIDPDVYMKLQDDVTAIQNGLEQTNTNLTQLDNKVMSQLAQKVDKVEGKQLSTNDYTNTEKNLVSQIPNKADRTYVDGLISGMADASPRDVFYSISALKTAFPTGNIGTYLVFDSSFNDGAHSFIWSESQNAWIDLGVYQAETVRDYSISISKTDFINTSLNLIDLTKVTRGQRFEDTGVITERLGYSLTDFIEVKPDTDYFVSESHRIAYYRSNFTLISATVDSDSAMVRRTPPDAKYVRISVHNRLLSKITMVEGTEPLPFYVSGGYETKVIDNQRQLEISAIKQHPLLNSFKKVKNYPFEIIDLLTDSEVTSENNRGTVVDDFSVRYKDNVKSKRVDCLDLTTKSNTARVDLKSPLNLIGVSEFLLVVYIEDVSKINNLTIAIPGTPFERGYIKQQTLVKGWNVLRIQTSAGSLTTWGVINQLFVNTYYSDATTYYIGGLYAIKPNKAQILFINDHGYHNFKEVAYPQLKALGIPTTWAINPGRLGAPITNVESILSQEDIDELAYDPYSEFSMHNWNPIGNATANMSADELLEDTHKCMTYLKKNGILPRYPWRAAFTQNLAPEHAVLQPYLDAYASPTEDTGMELYPFRNRYNVSRIAIHGRSNDYFDNIFELLQKTHSLLVCYTHGLDDSGGIHMTNAQLNYFLQKIEEGVTEGWLEGTTYSKLRGQYQFRDYKEVL